MRSTSSHPASIGVNMIPQQHHQKPPFLPLRDVIEYTSSTLPYSAKIHLIDSHEEVTTSKAKRMKLQCDGPIVHGNNKKILIHSSTSPSPQADSIILIDDNEIDVNEVRAMHEKIPSLPSPAHNRQGGISMLLSPEKIQMEPTQPLLRKIQSLNSQTTNGFAFDHHYFPKVVEVKSISSQSPSTPTITPNKSQRVRSFSQASKSQPTLQEPDFHDRVDETKTTLTDMSIYETIISAASHSSTISPAQKQYDLLFIFKQTDGQSDMFLVAKDRVFSVRRYDYKGESFFVHTDKNGKSTVMAKLPTVAQVTPQSYLSGGASTQQLPNLRSETTNVSLSSTEHYEHTFPEKFELHSSTKAPVTVTPVQRIFLHRTGARRKTAEHLPGNNNRRHDFGEGSIVEPNEVPSSSQMLYGSIWKPNDSPKQLPSDNALRLERRQFLLQQMNRLRSEKNEQTQRVLIGQQCLDPPSQSISKLKLHVVVNDKFQTTTAVGLNTVSAPITAQTSMNVPSSRQHVLNTNFWDRSPSCVHIEQKNTSGIPQLFERRQGYLSEQTVNVDSYTRRDRGDSSGLSQKNERRIQYQRLLREYIADQLTSLEESTPTTASVLANRRPDVVNARQHSSGRSDSELHRRSPQTTARVQMAPHPQRLDKDERHYSGRRSGDSNFPFDFEPRYIGEQQLGNQAAEQSSDSLISQPLSSPSFNPIQGELEENERDDAAKKILQLIDSRRRRLCSNSDFHQIRELLNTSGQIADEHSRAEQIYGNNRTPPVISQVSCGLIDRSTCGENVLPKRKATALVLDPEHSIYVDATDSVLDDDRRKSITVQQLSNQGEKISSVRSNKSGEASVSLDLPASLGRAWLQVSEPMRANSTATAQQHLSSSVTVGGSLSGVNNIFSQTQQSRTLPGNEHQLSYKNQSQQSKQTPLFDEQCAAMNALKEVIRRSNSSCIEYVEPATSQKKNINAVDANSERRDEVVQILIDPLPELAPETNSTVSSNDVGIDLLVCSQQGNSEMTQLQGTPQAGTPCDDHDDDDDDVVEITMPQPEGDTQFSITPDWEDIKKFRPTLNRESVANETPKARTTGTDKNTLADIVHLPPEQKFQPKMTAFVKEKNDDELMCSHPNGNSYEQPKCAIRTEKDDAVEVLAPIQSLSQASRPNSGVVLEHVVMDEETPFSNPLSCSDLDPSTDATNKEMNGSYASTMITPSAKNVPKSCARGRSKNDEKKKSLADLAEQYEREATLKTAQLRDELVKKITNTRERITKEKIEWKKKYLHRLEIQLRKRLGKIADGTELIPAEDEND